MRNVFVVGVHTIRFGKYLDKSIKDLTAMTVNGVFEDAGLNKKDIEALWFSNSGWGEGGGQTCIRGQVATRPLGIDAIPICNVENACASGSTAFHQAWMGVASGLYESTMAVGVEKLYDENKVAVFAGFLGGIDIEKSAELVQSLTGFQMTDEDRRAMEVFRSRYPVKQGSKRKKSISLKEKIQGRIKDARDNFVVFIRLGESIGYDKVIALSKAGSGDHSPFMDVYGFAARQHAKRFGSTPEQLAKIASKSHFHSTLNPNAQYQFPVSVEDCLADRIVSWPLTRSMCAPIGDGAASAILCSQAMVKKLGLSGRAVQVRASILGSGRDRPFGFDEPEIGERLSKLAYEKAGLGPQDINLAEVHDATAYGELRQAENLGFCPIGDGGRFAESGATKLGGKIPINPSGGLLSRGHPIGASGLAQIHELVTQLRGEAGKRQVENARMALAENGGGALGAEEAAMCIHILEAPARKG
jgi:acetyl-CoA acetyltransferase